MKKDKHLLLKSLVPSLLFIVLIWLIKLGEILTQIDLTFLGVYPQKAYGLIGIVTAPLIHGDLEHLSANSIPLFVLGSSLFYFYREIALKVLTLILLITGFSVWAGGREAYHIGASGIVYGLASFLFISGVVRKEPRLLAITLLVAFLYGSLVWGIFPDFFPEKNISFEGHFWGLVSGGILAFYFRGEGPQRKIYDWEREELEELEAPKEQENDDVYEHPENQNP
jgi:membrane associated rhomboid family serine protease